MHWIWLWLALFVAPDASAQGLAGFLSPGPLAEPHAELDAVTGCPSCHEPGKGVSPDRCMECHETVRDQVRSGAGFHSDKREACGTCHPEHKGRANPLVVVAEATFDHAPTGFPLEGPHLRAECVDCHPTPGEWTGLESACTSCHEEVHGSERPALDRCDDCHDVVDAWKVALVPASVFDHSDLAQVDWLLEGAHLTVGCSECHVSGLFRPTEHEACGDCHADPHHVTFGAPCEDCHTVVDFKVPDFDHARAGWPLEGQHRSVGCAECHGERVTEPLKHGACADCHDDPHDGQFEPRPCDTCHDLATADFRIERFDHERTEFPLQGRHATVSCAACHGDGPKPRWADLPHQDCDACHQDLHEGRFEPTACATCHTDEGWAVEDFDHALTVFPLEGLHADVPCAGCHPDAQWNGIDHDTCATCHADDDPHQRAFFPAQCTECHRATGWADRIYDHPGKAGFPLEPQHGAQSCLACHPVVTDFAGLDPACASCHAPSRPFGHYDGPCEGCHQAATWIPADLGDRDHAITGFPLEGLHSRLPCEACHAPERPHAEADGTCMACHATDDVHRHGLGDACGDCHTPTSWARSRFRHFATGWPLRGAHRLVACDACHATSYVATPTDCAVCHAGQATPSVPAHRSSFFLDCEGCHLPYTWSAAGFGH